MQTKPQRWALAPELTEAPELWRGCVGCWPFWEQSGSTVYDVSSNRYSGDIESATNTIVWQTGAYGPVLNYEDKDDNAIIVPTTAALTPKQLSLAVAFKSTKATGLGKPARLVSKWGAGKYEWQFHISGFDRGSDGNRNQLAFEARNITLVDTDATIVGGDNLWHYAIATWGDGYLRIFLDGKKELENSISDDLPDNGVDLGLGGQPDLSNANSFDGDLSDIRMWNRALTEGEVSQVFDSWYTMLRPRHDLFSAPVLLGGAETSGGGGGGGGGIDTGSPQVNVIL